MPEEYYNVTKEYVNQKREVVYSEMPFRTNDRKVAERVYSEFKKKSTLEICYRAIVTLTDDNGEMISQCLN